MSFFRIRCTLKIISFPSTMQFPNNTLFVCAWCASSWLSQSQITLVIYEMLHLRVMLTWKHLEESQMQSYTNNLFSFFFFFKKVRHLLSDKQIVWKPGRHFTRCAKQTAHSHQKTQFCSLLRKNQIGLGFFFPYLMTWVSSLRGQEHLSKFKGDWSMEDHIASRQLPQK